MFNENLDYIGVIDDYSKLENDMNYHDHSAMYITVAASEENTEKLLNVDYENEMIIIAKENDLQHGYIIEVVEYVDESELDISIVAKSLSILMNRRVIEGQQRFTGDVGSVMKGFVNANAITPSNTNRVIPKLVLSNDVIIETNTDEVYTNKELDVALWEIAKKHDVSFEILMNHTNKKFEFRVLKGDDRSIIQNENQHVAFAKELDNVVGTTYVDDCSSVKNTAIILGENNVIVISNNENKGFLRREIVVDASSIQKTYQNEDGTETTITDIEYEALMNDKGLNTLSEYKRARTFENSINYNSQFIFNRDFFIGDIVTAIDQKIGIMKHSRVTKVNETFEKGKYELKVSFGTSVPTLIDKIKREVKR